MDFSKGDKRPEECNLLLKRKSSHWSSVNETSGRRRWGESYDSRVPGCLQAWESPTTGGLTSMWQLRDCVALCADRERENLAEDTLRSISTSFHLKISCWWDCKMAQPLWKIAWPILTNTVTLPPTDSTSRFKPKRTENLCPHKTCTWTLKSALFTSLIVETTPIYTDWWTDIQNVVWPYKGISLGNRKEWSTDTC